MPYTSYNNNMQRACGCRCGNNSGTMPAGTAFCKNGGMPNNEGIMPTRSMPLNKDLSLATTYVVPQVYTESYTTEQALKSGTCFPELDMPYAADSTQ